jgi:ferredoxin--NADP+ reductase
VREVVVVGRRGAAQAAFTNPELLELGELTDADVVVDSEELEFSLALEDPNLNPTAQRNVKALRAFAARPLAGHHRRIVLRFLLSPVALLAGEQGGVGSVRLVRNELVAGEDGSLRAQATGEHETLDAGLVLRAIGYRGVALPDEPFDERRGTIRNDAGRVTEEDGTLRRGEYVVGWIKRGPSGVIGTNKKDAQETVDALLADLQAGGLLDPPAASADAVERLMRARKPDTISYAGWSEIDRHEQALGQSAGRPRVKLTRIEEMLRVAGEQQPEDSLSGG